MSRAVMSESSDAEQEVAAELLRDFLDDYEEKSEMVEADIKVLRQNPEDEESLANIFRSVHTIKGNAIFCYMDEIGRITHAFEEVYQYCVSIKLSIRHVSSSSLSSVWKM